MLRLTESIYTAIRRHGEQTYPHECCGVLLGRSEPQLPETDTPETSPEATTDPINEVHEAVPAGNTRTDSAHNRYHIAPQELVRIQRHARQHSLDIVGFYHSHPDHPAQWSPTDFAEAHWIGCSYVITSVQQGIAADTNSFLLTGISEDDKAFQNESVQIAAALTAASGKRAE